MVRAENEDDLAAVEPGSRGNRSYEACTDVPMVPEQLYRHHLYKMKERSRSDPDVGM